MMNFDINKEENYKDGYYHISKDVFDYPDAIIYIVWSRRGPGKTYGSLRYPYHKFKTLYMKRTNKDVKTICTWDSSSDFDPSPWSPINRDFGTNVHPKLLQEGIGAFYDCDEEGKTTGSVINYIASLNAIKTIKGIDLSDAEWIIFDEFIPQPGEVTKRDEGEMLLNLYETVNRDRVKRGRPPLKLILFANAEEISTHITSALEVVDTMAEMQARNIGSYFDRDRGIFFRHINKEDFPISEKESSGMARVMRGTAYAAKAYEGQFANNDFSNVQKLSLKGMRCLYHLHYKRQHDAYIYIGKNGVWYMCHVKGPAIESYNLDRENDQKRFHADHVMDLREACINDRMRFEKYSYYNLIINYAKIYDL